MVGGRTPQPVPCERALELVSARLDAELSELEEAALGHHLDACARCAAAAARVESLTRLVRGAPLARPSRRVELPQRPPRPLARLTAVAALVVLAVAFSILGAAVGSGPEPRAPTVEQEIAVVPEDALRDLRELPRAGEDGRPPRPPRPTGVPV